MHIGSVSKLKPTRATTVLAYCLTLVNSDKNEEFRYFAKKILTNALAYVREQRALEQEKEFWED